MLKLKLAGDVRVTTPKPAPCGVSVIAAMTIKDHPQISSQRIR
jgi:hypothetical protein